VQTCHSCNKVPKAYIINIRYKIVTVATEVKEVITKTFALSAELPKCNCYKYILSKRVTVPINLKI
jgi:hypothetical protein